MSATENISGTSKHEFKTNGKGDPVLAIPRPNRQAYDPFTRATRDAMPRSSRARSGNGLVVGPSEMDDGGRLVVGEGVRIKGEIHACDSLAVWGTVDSAVKSALLQIYEPGVVLGEAKVGSAEVRGRFEGSLQVENCLLIHAEGKVSGKVRYGQLEVVPGGEICGDVATLTARKSGRRTAKAAKAQSPASETEPVAAEAV